MKATDLRIGNKLQKENGEIFTVRRLDNTEDILVEEERCLLTLGYNLFGIELTEEWLLKMGITKNGRGEFEYKRYCLYQSVSYVNFLFCKGNLVLREIKYVHTLQNLIHALTGEELTIK